MLRLKNGAMFTVQSNFNIPDEAAKWRLEFFGTKGRLLGDTVIGQIDGGSVDAMFMSEVGGYDAVQDVKKAETTVLKADTGNMYTREIESFGRSILENRPLEVPAAEAVQVQRIIEAAYRSNDEKRFIDL
jgi:predicted dehydrogenase